MTVLLNSLVEAKNNKDMKKPQTINVQFSIPEAMILYHLANWNIIEKEMNECEHLDKFVKKHTESYFLYSKMSKHLEEIGIQGHEIGSSSLQSVLNKYNDEQPLFTFLNGLKAEYSENKIIIGCRSFTVEALLEKIDSFLEFGVDNVKIEGYSFSSKELKELKNWAQNLKN